MKQIWHFVITGGPCSGKTTAMSILEQELSNRGYYVLIVPETATELIPNGIRPSANSLSNLQFQYVVLEKQLQKEEMYEKVANLLPAKKVVILYDRGIIDNKSYISEMEFKNLLADFATNEVEVRDKYDAVFHLVTAADGAEEYYTLENNSARTETPEEARVLDKKGIKNWTGHSHLRVIDNRSDFQDKIRRLMCEVYASLGDPVPVEIERKYLVKKPNIESLSKTVPITAVDIVQTYLQSEEGIERRIRQRGQDGNFSYFYTEKKEISPGKRIEVERKISEKQYISFLTEMNLNKKSLVKKRICFVYQSQYFEVDIYDFSNEYALMEIELTAENDSVKLPDFIDIVKEVTDDKKYLNANLSKTQKLE